MASLQKIRKNTYALIKMAIGCQLSGKAHKKIIHKVFFIRSNPIKGYSIRKKKRKVYEYGILHLGIIHTSKELIGKRITIIARVKEYEQPKE